MSASAYRAVPCDPGNAPSPSPWRTINGVRLGLTALCLIVVPGNVLAEEAGEPPQAARKPLVSEAQRALQWGVHMDSEEVTNFQGGLQTGTVFTNVLHLAAAADTGPVGLWDGGRLRLSAVKIWSGQPSEKLVGDLQGVSNLAAPPATRLYDLSYRQQWSSLGIGVQAGLIDANEQFAATDAASILSNASFGMTPTITGNVPTSTYPEPGWGALISAATSHWDVQLGLFQGNPEARGKAFGSGYMALAEAAYGAGSDEDSGPRYKLGVWRYRPGGDTLDAPTQDWGAYAIAEGTLARTPRLQGFLQLGAAPGGQNRVPYYLGAGMTFSAPFPSRPNDFSSIGVAQARIHSATGHPETAYEVAYVYRLSSSLFLQPDLQLVTHPDGRGDIGDALIALLRLHMELY